MISSKFLADRSFIVGIGGLCLIALCHKLKADNQKPNVLIIVTDDQRWDAIQALSPHKWLKTPNMDKLVNQGVAFTSAYCQTPLSAASRASILSGRYAHRNGIYGFENYPDTSSVLRPWLPEILNQNGYQCALFGKDGTGRMTQKENGTFAGGNEKYFKDGFIELNDYAKAGKKVDESKLDFKKYGVITRTSSGGVIIGGIDPNPAGQTIDAYIAEDAVKFINAKASKENNPFYLHVGFNFPHTPVLVPKPFDTLYDATKMNISEFTSEEFNKMSPQVQGAVDRFMMKGLTKEQIQKTIANYYAYNTYGDIYFGKVVDAFKKKSQEQRREWIIILVSDNGWHLGEHGMNAKFTYYDQSVRLPLIVSSSSDKFKKGKKCSNIAEFVDIVPTILTFAGIEQPDYLDGRDLYQTYINSIEPRKEAISEEFHVMRRGMVSGKFNDQNFVFSMRTRPENFVLGADMEWVKTASVEELDIHLFDIDADPAEINNLAGNPQFSKVISYFKSRLIDRLFSNRIEPRWQDIIEQRQSYGNGVLGSELSTEQIRNNK
jgi:arylsulfatase A-like enzyme